MSGYCAELFGAGDVIELTGLSGTEDFTAVAEQIPAAMFHLGVGSIAEGHTWRRPQPEDDGGRVGAVPGRCPLCLLRRPLPGRAPGLIPGPLCIRHTAPGTALPYINRKAPDTTPPGTFLPYLSLIIKNTAPVLPGRYFLCFSALPVTVSRRDGRRASAQAMSSTASPSDS